MASPPFAAVVVFLFGRARLPSVVGLLVAGVTVGPSGLSLVSDVESVRVLAEIVVGRLVIPGVLHEVVRLRNRELFLMTIVPICVGTAAITARAVTPLVAAALPAWLDRLAASRWCGRWLGDDKPGRPRP